MKNYYSILFVIISLCFFNTPSLKASHVEGGEVTYRYLGSNKYQFTIVYYRDCSYVSLGTPDCAIRCSDNSVNDVFQLTLSLVSIENIKLKCNTGCYPKDTYGTGPGLEKHTFTAQLDLNDSKYKDLFSCSGFIRVETSQVTRISYTNAASYGGYYNYADFEIKNNIRSSSPVFSNDPRSAAQLNKRFQTSHNAHDTADMDSLSYEFITPQVGLNKDISFNSNYEYYQPFDAYYPGTLKYPYVNPNYEPPIGTYLNPYNGELIFTPSKSGTISIYAIAVKEWRLDSTNTYKHIGTIVRDMDIRDYSNSNNYEIPRIACNESYNVCEGVFTSIDIKGFEKYNPSQKPLDSVYISWNKIIPAATFQTGFNNTTYESAQLSWTPNKDDVRKKTHEFVVSVRDNNCNYNSVLDKVVKMNVHPFVKYDAKSTVIIAGCGKYALDIIKDTAIKDEMSYTWQVLDKNGNIVIDSIAYFSNSNSSFTSKKNDTISFFKAGSYQLRYSIQNPKNNCSTFYFDTIEVINGIIMTKIIPNADTVCIGNQVNLDVTCSIKSKLTYQWMRDGVPLSDKDSFISFKLTDTLTRLNVFVSDNLLCHITDSIDIRLFKTIKQNFKNPTYNCKGLVINLQIDPTKYHSFKWQDKSTNNNYISNHSENISVDYKDNHNCELFESFQTIFHELPPLNIDDFNACEMAIVNPGKFEAYLWNDSLKTSSIEITKSGRYWLKVIDTNNCVKVDSFDVIVHPNPIVKLANDTSICKGPLTIQLDTAYKALWSTNETTNKITISQGGIYSVKATDKNGCFGIDSIKVTIFPKTLTPKLTLSNDTLWSDRQGKLNWYKDNILYNNTATNFLKLNIDGTYTVDYQDSNGCNSDLSNEIVYIKGSVIHPTIPFKVYPNPNNGKFYVELAKGQILQIKKIELYDLVGKKVLFSSNISNNTVEISNHSISGSFIIDIEFENGESIRQMVVFQK